MSNNKIVDREGLKAFRVAYDQRIQSGTIAVGKAILAEQIASDRIIENAEDSCPAIVFGTTGGDAEIQSGYSSFKELRGKTVIWNQLAGPASTDYWTVNGGTVSSSNNVLSFVNTSYTDTGGPEEKSSVAPLPIVGHKYLVKYKVKSDTATSTYVRARIGGSGSDDYLITSSWEEHYSFIEAREATGRVRFWVKTQTSQESATFDFKDIQLFDLTLLFGAGKEPNSIVEFNNLYTKNYYNYALGSLVSNIRNTLISVGKNQWDEEYETGGLADDGTTNNSNSYRSVNFTKVIAGGSYKVVMDETMPSLARLYVLEYDGNKNFITRQQSNLGEKSHIYELGNNTQYVKLSIYYADGTRPDTMKCLFRIYWGEEDTIEYDSYEAYDANIYELPDVALNSAGSAYDSIAPTGVITRRIEKVNILDMLTGSGYAMDTPSTGGHTLTLRRGYGYLTDSKLNAMPSKATVIGNVICNRYETITQNTNYNQEHTARTINETICVNSPTADGNIRIHSAAFDSFTDKTDFNTYFTNNPTYIQYELETSYTENTNTFAELVYADNFGTLHFIDDSENDVQIPQPYYIEYTVNLVEFLDSTYALTGGDPNEIATKTYVGEAMSEIDLTDYAKKGDALIILDAPSSTSLSADEIATISKGCVINGTFLGLVNPLFIAAAEQWGIYFGLVIGVNATNRQPQIQQYQIQGGTIALRADTQQQLDIHNINSLNGKAVPAYPSNTGTFVLKCVNGTLTWVAE